MSGRPDRSDQGSDELRTIEERAARSRSLIQAISEELSAIIERIERDTSVLGLPEDGAPPKGRRRWTPQRAEP